MPVPGRFKLGQMDKASLGEEEPDGARGAIEGMMMQNAHTGSLLKF